MVRKLIFAIIAGVLLRCLFISSPLLDAFGGMRQTYTAGFTQFLLNNPITFDSIIHPNSIVLTSSTLELPLYNLITVLLAKTFGDNIYVYRLTSVIFWLLSAIYLAWMSVRVWGKPQAVYIVWVYALFPMSIFLGHYYHPEILAVFLSIVVVFHFYLFLQKEKPLDLIMSLVALTLVLMVRASQFHLYFILAILLFSKYGWRTFAKPWAYLILLTLIPYAYWIFSGTDLGSEMRVTQFFGPMWVRFSPIYWGMIVFHRIGGIGLSPLGVPLLIAGVAAGLRRTNRDLEYAWLYSSIAFLIIVARACFHHPHYQSVLLVPSAIIIGRFFYQIAENSLTNSWYSWWLKIPKWVKVTALSIYVFLDVFVIYLFFNLPWDAQQLDQALSLFSIGQVVQIFLISQIFLIPLIYLIWQGFSRNGLRFSNTFPVTMLFLILVTGIQVLSPFYEVDTDYIDAGKSVARLDLEDGTVIFIGKKDDADPFIYYSGMTGWAFNSMQFISEDADDIDTFLPEDAKYIAIMKSNRYIQPGQVHAEEIQSWLEKFVRIYQDDLILVYRCRKEPLEFQTEPHVPYS